MSSLVKIKNVSKSFMLGPRKIEVLKNFNLDVQEGEMMAIVGQSGSGKTTLLHLLGTLDKPDAGEIVFSNQSLTSIEGSELEKFRNKNIGFVFQFFQLLPEFTALENVMIPQMIGDVTRKEASDVAREYLKLVGLEDRLNHLPNQMSGGEQQRAAIARALVNKPRLLLADEPTGNLDVNTGERVFKVFKDLQKKYQLTTVIVTHNPGIAGQCDRFINIDKI